MGFVDEVKYFDFWWQHDECEIHITWSMLPGSSHPAVSEADLHCIFTMWQSNVWCEQSIKQTVKRRVGCRPQAWPNHVGEKDIYILKVDSNKRTSNMWAMETAIGYQRTGATCRREEDKEVTEWKWRGGEEKLDRMKAGEGVRPEAHYSKVAAD